MRDHLSELYEQENRIPPPSPIALLSGLTVVAFVAATVGHVALAWLGATIAAGIDPTMFCTGAC